MNDDVEESAMAQDTVDGSRDEAVCHSCASVMRPSARFCPRCGAAAVTQATAPPESSVRASALVFAVYLLASLIVGLASRIVDDYRLDLAATLLTTLIAVAFAYSARRALRPLLAFRRPSLRGVCVSTAGAIAGCSAVSLVFLAAQLGGISLVDITAPYARAGVSPLITIAAIACLPAIGEELAFRGIIQADLSRMRGEREGWLLQGILFGVAHLFPLNFLTHAGFGLALGWVRLRTRSLYPGMLIHAAWNAWVVYDELFGA